MGLNWLRYALIELTRDRTQSADYYQHIADGCFIGIWGDGRSVLSWRGRNYVPQKLSVRTRVHNWLARV